jgi:adenylyltransferase/sulfurtransferase
MIVTAEEFERIQAQAEAEYPYECCGVILIKDGSPPDRTLLPCRNVQNELHAKDPELHPRDARTAYSIAPQDLLGIARMESDGWSLKIIYHSHIDAGAYFSETDARQALLGGEPSYPDAAYLVLSVVEGKAADAAAFRWNPESRAFAPVPFEAS